MEMKLGKYQVNKRLRLQWVRNPVIFSVMLQVLNRNKNIRAPVESTPEQSRKITALNLSPRKKVRVRLSVVEK